MSSNGRQAPNGNAVPYGRPNSWKANRLKEKFQAFNFDTGLLYLCKSLQELASATWQCSNEGIALVCVRPSLHLAYWQLWPHQTQLNVVCKQVGQLEIDPHCKVELIAYPMAEEEEDQSAWEFDESGNTENINCSDKMRRKSTKNKFLIILPRPGHFSYPSLDILAKGSHFLAALFQTHFTPGIAVRHCSLVAREVQMPTI